MSSVSSGIFVCLKPKLEKTRFFFFSKLERNICLRIMIEKMDPVKTAKVDMVTLSTLVHSNRVQVGIKGFFYG